MQSDLRDRVSELERRVNTLEKLLLHQPNPTPAPAAPVVSRYKTTTTGNFNFVYKPRNFTYMESHIIPTLVEHLPKMCRPKDKINIYVEFAAARPNFPDVNQLPDGRSRRNFAIILQQSPKDAIRVPETMDGVVRMVAVYLLPSMENIDFSTSHKALDVLCQAIEKLK